MASSVQAQSRSVQSDSGSHSKEVKIVDIPQIYRDKLCHHLDEMNVWMDLAEMMQVNRNDINTIQRRISYGESPSDNLYRIWGIECNHTVLELFMLLYHKGLYSAMQILKEFVPYKYRLLISNSVPALSQLLKPKTESQQSKKLLNCSSFNTSGLRTTDDNYTTTSEATSQDIQHPQNNVQTAILSERSVQQYVAPNMKIDYDELSKATDNWNKRNYLGKGGFGTVYKGYWKLTEVAIKQIHYCASNGGEDIKVQTQQSLNELKCLISFRHDNVLPLYGFSLGGEKPCLVYQYMRGGCLDKRLHSGINTPLTLSQRIKICIGTARGINFLHTHTPHKPLIHGDIKPANVLLDECLMPKIGDFGLAREGPNAIKNAVKVSQVFGTKCYLPPEFLELKKLSTQVDTYSFGVTLLETFTGQRAYEKDRQFPLLTEYVARFPKKNLIQLLDPKLKCKNEEIQDTEYKIFLDILSLGLRCVATSPHDRPEMENVFMALKEYDIKDC